MKVIKILATLMVCILFASACTVREEMPTPEAVAFTEVESSIAEEEPAKAIDPTPIIEYEHPFSPSNKLKVEFSPARSEPSYTEEQLEILAIIIYQELGGDAASDLGRLAVGNVFLNRVANEDFPDTFEEVATQKGQYGTLHSTGIQWPKRMANPGEAHAIERAYDLAERLLEGERVLPDDVIWQAEFPQGDEVVLKIDGMYFCR